MHRIGRIKAKSVKATDVLSDILSDIFPDNEIKRLCAAQYSSDNKILIAPKPNESGYPIGLTHKSLLKLQYI